MLYMDIVLTWLVTLLAFLMVRKLTPSGSSL